jgi:hypothetical protein
MNTYKEKLRTFVLQTLSNEPDIEEMLSEVDSYDEERCKEELNKAAAFSGFAETLKEQIEVASADAKITDLPIIQAESQANDLCLSGTLSSSKH